MPRIHIKQRDRRTLRLLSFTQAPAALILKAAATFQLPEEEEPYANERRVRERMQALAGAGLVRYAPLAMPSGGVANWYRLTAAGYRTVFGDERPPPLKAFLEPIKVSLQEHTLRLAEAIVQTIVASHRARVHIGEFRRENELRIAGGHRSLTPDAFFRFERSGRRFHVMFELDNGTEPLDSRAPHSLREKLLTYEAHQDDTLGWWRRQGRPRRVNPRFRALFLTRTAERAENIAALAADVARNPDRLLCYTLTLDDYLSAADCLRQPICLDHRGAWRPLIQLYRGDSGNGERSATV